MTAQSQFGLPDRQEGEPAITTAQIVEIAALAEKIGLADFQKGYLELLGNRQARMLLAQLQRIWDGQAVLDAELSGDATEDNNQTLRLVGWSITAALVFLIIFLIVANMHF